MILRRFEPEREPETDCLPSVNTCWPYLYHSLPPSIIQLLTSLGSPGSAIFRASTGAPKS